MQKNIKTTDKNKQKKIIILFFVIMSILLIMYYGVSFVLSYMKKSDTNSETTRGYAFSYPNYSENIFDDKQYMGCDRNIYYTTYNGAMTVSIERDSMEDVSEQYRDVTLFLMDFIDIMTNGDVESFNSCYDNSYYKGSVKPKENFTQQKIYNILITAVSESELEKNGKMYESYIMGIDYMIKNNNGTLRDDMGSDAIRRKYLSIIKIDDETFKIISESYFPEFVLK